MLEQGRIVTWLDRNSEYADDLDAVQELLDDATLITINANLFETKLRIFAEDTKSRYVPFFKSSARVADLKKHLAGIADADKRSDRKTFLAAMSAVLLKTQQRSFSVLFAKLASMTQDNPLDALKWGLDAYFWEGAHAIRGYDGKHTFDALMTWLFVMNANGWDYRHNSAQRERRRKELWFDDTKALWDAARAGARLLTHLRALPGIAFSDAAEGFARYTAPDGGLWAIDQEYRHYVRASRAVHVNDVLTDLDRHVENAYRDDYLRPLSRTWDDALRGMRTWDITVPPSSGRIDSFYRLLPHRELTLGVRGKDQVVVETDGQSTAGIDARRTILEGADGRAFTYEELKQDTIKVMRSKFKGASAVYIYHDVIDATGDHAASESGTPDAVNRAIDELSALVSKLISADITRILVTADHGFLFQDSEPANDDTAKQGGVPRGRSISVKKRRGRPRRRHRPALRRHVPEGQPFQPPRHPTRAHQSDTTPAHRHD